MNSTTTDQDTGNQDLFITRMPVFDREKNIWAYELAYHGDPDVFSPAETDSAILDRVMENTEETLGAPNWHGKTLITLCGDALPHCQQAVSLNGSHVISLTSPATDADRIDSIAKTLQDNGSRLALDSSVEPEAFSVLKEHADIVTMSMKNHSPKDVIAFRKQMKDFTGRLLATDVETWEDYQGTRALGFALFQGSFFTRPFSLTEQTLNSASVAKLGLLRELNAPELDMQRLADVIATDVSLSYRLLRYINSAAFGLPNTIKSIQQAVSLLGTREIRRWAMVVAMTDMDNTPKGEELAYMALQRARFLEQLTDSLPSVKHPCEQMFLLGLFSRLDALMGNEMSDILKDIPLDAELLEALCGQRGSELGDALDMLDAVERADWKTANALLLKYKACFTTTATHYLKASTWASRQVAGMI